MLTARPVHASGGMTSARRIYASPDTPYARAMLDAETAYLTAQLAAHAGNITATARTIGLSRRTLQLRIVACGIATLPAEIREAERSA